jgi:hypothetical protein
MSELTSLLDIIDRLDVPTLAIVTIYGFWRVTRLISRVDAHIATRIALIELKCDQLSAQFAAHAQDDKDTHTRLFTKLDRLQEKVT